MWQQVCIFYISKHLHIRPPPNMVGIEMVKKLFEYSDAMNERFLSMAENLTEAQLNESSGYSHGSLGSLLWPAGNQIFAIEAVSASFSLGFPFETASPRGESRRHQRLFFAGFDAVPRRRAS